MKYFFVIISAVLVMLGVTASAQTTEVRNYLRMVAQGKIQEVKKALPDLLADYPDDPGVMLLHGVVIEDGYKAVEKYKKIVTEYPQSEWADDAYWRIVQFYAVTGDTTAARRELENYRKKFPTSDFLIAATDVVKSSVSFARKEAKSIKHIDEAKEEAAPKAIPSKKKLEKPTTKTESASTEKHFQKEESEDLPKEKTTKSKQPKKQDESKSTEKTTKGKFGLQVGIYSSQDAAKAEVERFRNQRMVAAVYTKKVDDVPMYAVVVGDYNSKESAEQAKSIVQNQCKCMPLLFEK